MLAGGLYERSSGTAGQPLAGYRRRSKATRDIADDSYWNTKALSLQQLGDVGAWTQRARMLEIWGVSTDGKHVAIHIAGADVPGVLSKGGGNPFHFFFIAAMP